MDDIVRYELDGAVATITMDDGKVNALSPRMLEALNGALDRAEADGAVVVLAGREGLFSAGFDLKVLRGGGPEANDMVAAGFELSHRLLSFARPVVIACTGHAIAMGVFLLLSGDDRVGPEGEFRIVANEVALGLTMPHTAVEICRQRLTPAAFNRAVLLSEEFGPDAGVAAGFLDRLAPPGEVVATARERAAVHAGLNLAAHAGSKPRVRQAALDAIRAGIEADRNAVLAAG